MNPRVSFGGRIHSKLASGIPSNTKIAHIPTCFCRTRRQKADQVRHVAATEQQTAAGIRVTDEGSDPSYGLRLDLRSRGREYPRADIRVQSCGEKVAKNTDRRRRRRDVSEETRMSIEERVREQQLRSLFQQSRRVHSRLRERTSEIQRVTNGRGGFIIVYWTMWYRLEESGHLIHETMSKLAEHGAVHLDRGVPAFAIHDGLLVWRLALRTDSFQEVRFPVASAVYDTENPIKG